MPRRNVFGEDEPPDQTISSVPSPANSGDFFSTTPIISDQLLSSIDMIPRVRTKRERNRDWDKAHPARRFRKVAPELVAAIAAIAAEQNLPNSEVAQAFLEFGFECYQKRLLEVEPNLEGSRRTLYPRGDNNPKRAWKYTPGGNRNGKTESHKKKKKVKLEMIKRDWENGATWRLPDQIVLDLRELSGVLRVPVGEIITLLGQFSLEKYGIGELTFESQPVYRNSSPQNASEK